MHYVVAALVLSSGGLLFAVTAPKPPVALRKVSGCFFFAKKAWLLCRSPHRALLHSHGQKRSEFPYHKCSRQRSGREEHLAKMKSGRKLQDQLDSGPQATPLPQSQRAVEPAQYRRPLPAIPRREIRGLCVLSQCRFHAAAPSAAEGESDLLPHIEYCYERSIGCVGLVKDWLTRALALALNQGAHAVSLKMLERTAWSLDQSERMAREAVDGESEVGEKGQKRDRLKQLLQMGATTSSAALSPPCMNPPSPQRRTRVGQRKPVRGLVGVTREV